MPATASVAPATALTAATLEALRAIDTPSICNAIELFDPERRGFGFTTRTMHCLRPDLPPIVGYARTVQVRAARASSRAAEAVRDQRFGYLDYLATPPGPTIAVVEDLDDARAGFGSFWGEVNSNIHRALGCIGGVTNGSMRDLTVIAEGFQLLAGVVAPSHGHIHVVGFGGDVSVLGMAVRSGDLIHADRHGAVVIPHEIAARLPEAVALVARREKLILDACRARGASAASISQAIAESARVK